MKKKISIMLKKRLSKPIKNTLPFQNIATILKIFWVVTVLLLPGGPFAQARFTNESIPEPNFEDTDFVSEFEFFRGDALENFDLMPHIQKWTNYSPERKFKLGLDLHTSKGSEWLSIALMQESARAGHYDAAIKLSEFYFNGSVHPVDMVRALEWFTKAILLKNGNATTFHNEQGQGLASTIATLQEIYGDDFHDWYGDNQSPDNRALLRYGEEILDDEILATIRMADVLYKMAESNEDKKISRKTFGMVYELYRDASDKGSLEAMTKAGKLLMEGKGVEKNEEKALELWKQAGKHGYAPAIFEYGLALGEKTESTPHDPVGAYDHLRSAQDRGLPKAGEAADNLVVKHCRKGNHILCQPVPLLYATTRNIAKNVNDGSTLSFGRDPGNSMHFGETWRPILSHPEEPPDGSWLKRRWLQIKKQWRNINQVKLRHNKSWKEEEFFKTLGDTSGLMVFIHGYNNSFDDAARAAAEFVFRASLDLIPIIYSWPSLGTIPGYLHDLDRQRADCGNLADFLSRIAKARNGKGKADIRIVAHSMGSELLFSALTSCSYTGESYSNATDSDQKSVGHIAEIVLAAPDIGVADFKHSLDTFVSKVNRVTIYRSAEDRVLDLSELIHVRVPRLGDGGHSPVISHDKVQTIEVMNVGSSMRHAYVFQDVRVIRDIKETFSAEDNNQGLVQQDHRNWRVRINAEPPYWKIGDDP